MKVTDIKTFAVDCFRTNWVFVKVYTDEGIDGVGDGTLDAELFAQLATRENPDMPMIIEHLTTDEEYINSFKYVKGRLNA